MHVSKAFYRLAVTAVISCSLLTACSPPASHDLILRGGNVYDGSGGEPFVGDVAIDGDKIVGLGDIGNATAAVADHDDQCIPLARGADPIQCVEEAVLSTTILVIHPRGPPVSS